MKTYILFFAFFLPLFTLAQYSSDYVYGKVPWTRGVVMDNNNSQHFYQLRDGSLDNTDISVSSSAGRVDVDIMFAEEQKVIIDKIVLGDGQHNHAANDPMKTWFYDTLWNRIAGPDFYGNGSYVQDTFQLSSPMRTDVFVMQLNYPMPTEVQFYGWYKPIAVNPYSFEPSTIDKHIGAVIYPWNIDHQSGLGVDTKRMQIADFSNVFRYYADMGNVTENNTGLAVFQPQSSGAWGADDILDSMKRRGKDVLFCIKGREGIAQYTEVCRQAAIRYGNNKNVPDSAVHIFTGPGFPANVVKKGLGLIKYIQLGNEVDRTWKGLWSPTNTEGIMTPFQVAQYEWDCYKAIKAIDSSIIVISSGLVCNNPGYPEGMYLWARMYNNGKFPVDAIAYHDYNNTLSGQNQTGAYNPGVPPEQGKMMERAQAQLQEMSVIGRADHKIGLYITESGYSISDSNISQAPPNKGIGGRDKYHVQADWTVRSVLATQRAGLTGAVTYYQLYDDDYYINDTVHWMNWDLSCGLLYQNIQASKDQAGGIMSLRPVSRYLLQIDTLMRGYKLASWSMNADSVYVDKFVKQGNNNIWSLVKGTAKGNTATYNLALPGVKSIEINMLNDTGLITNKTYVSVNGSYTITVGETPVFIKENPLSKPVYRINAGGPKITNSIGTFAADTLYSPNPGNIYSVTSPIAGTTNGAMYQTERYSVNGNLSYAFPVGNGRYSVILHFAELYWTAAGKRLFDVNIEGNKVLDNYDIFAKVGALTATSETFSVTVTDGALNIDFSSLPVDGGVDQAKVSAIEIISNPVTSYRINAGGPQVTNSIGTFTPDSYYSPAPGNTLTTTTAIAGTTNGAMYQTERYGSSDTMGYAVPVSNGSYSVTLHFAEIYWTAAGKRIFDVSIEGNKVLDNYDIFRKVGAFTATSETFTVNVTDGVLNINFSSLPVDGGLDQPKVSAIEIISTGSAIVARKAMTIEEQPVIIKPDSKTLKAYPNPNSNGHYTVLLPKQLEGQLSYTLYSLTGTRLVGGMLLLKKPTSFINFDFSGAMISSGEYYLSLKGKELKGQVMLMRIR